MKCIRTFQRTEVAREHRQKLTEQGIESKLYVDPMEGMYPSHSHYTDVALVVAEKDVARAEAALGGKAAALMRRAS